MRICRCETVVLGLDAAQAPPAELLASAADRPIELFAADADEAAAARLAQQITGLGDATGRVGILTIAWRLAGAPGDAERLLPLLDAAGRLGIGGVNLRLAAGAPAAIGADAGNALHALLRAARMTAERSGVALSIETPPGDVLGAAELADLIDGGGSWVFGAGVDLSRGADEVGGRAALATLRQRVRLIRLPSGADRPAWLEASLEAIDFDGVIVGASGVTSA
jgi:hypothetical protein